MTLQGKPKGMDKIKLKGGGGNFKTTFERSDNPLLLKIRTSLLER